MKTKSKLSAVEVRDIQRTDEYENKVYNFHTDQSSYVVVDKYKNNILVHNCLCIPDCNAEDMSVNKDVTIATNYLQQLHDQFSDLQIRFASFEICKDVAQHPAFIKEIGVEASKLHQEMSSAIIGKKLLISKWAKSYARAYIVALGNLHYKKFSYKEMQQEPALKFPAFNKNHLLTLQKASILEFDGKHYCFTKEFLHSTQKHSQSQLLDDLMHARQYIVRWNVDGNPVYDNTDLFGAIDDQQQFFINAFCAYFFDNDDLRQGNEGIWEWIFNKVGKIIKVKDI